MWVSWWVAIFLFEIGCSNAKISQPWSLLKKEGESIGLLCRQNDGHNVMAWYQQSAGQNLQLLYSFYLNEEQAKGSNISVRFTAERPDKTDFNLNISPAKPEDSAVYFCASSRQEDSEVHFGKGTRLTVIGEGEHSSPPKVTIFSPSTQELKEKNKATIVCLVTDFYPDHIILTWSVNGKERKEGVNTETPKVESTGKYSLISRLRVTSQEWQNSYNKFVCKVDFYDETKASFYEESILGIDCDGGIDQAKETYLRTANLGKLVYILLIFKSILYGAFVMGWKLRKK